MALTTSRWIALALLGFVLAPVLIFRENDPEAYRWTHRAQLQARAGRALYRARTAAERLRTTQLADSVVASLPAARGGTHRVMFDRAFDTTSLRLLAALARDATLKRPDQPRTLTDIVFVVDTVQIIGGVQRRGFSGALALNYMLPSAEGASGRCIVIARVRPWGANELKSDVSRERLLGPCAFYEAFGTPGPAIARWLDNGGWSLAQTNWQLGPSTWGAAWMWRSFPLRHVLGMRGVSCAAGSDSACAAAIEHAAGRASILRSNTLRTEFNPYVMSSGWYTRDWDFGIRSPALLADMVTDLGPERFARFWQSDLDPAAAFRTAAGTELPRWTRRWLHRTYHEEKMGAGFSGAGLAWGAAILLLALGVILRTAERRQMA